MVPAWGELSPPRLAPGGNGKGASLPRGSRSGAAIKRDGARGFACDGDLFCPQKSRRSAPRR